VNIEQARPEWNKGLRHSVLNKLPIKLAANGNKFGWNGAGGGWHIHLHTCTRDELLMGLLSFVIKFSAS